MAKENAIIEVKHLTKIFDNKVKAVDNLNFNIKSGEIFGFLGPNGAGKSTTINMLTTLFPPTSGTAIVCGHDISKEAMEVRKAIGTVPQDYTSDSDMTGQEYIMFCADLYGIPRNVAVPRATELLKLVSLQDVAKNKIDSYSGGMRRRFELACGLINRPRLLFLDEPTLGLDVQTRTAVWNYITRLKKEYAMTIFLTTHYLEEVDALCDRVAIIDHGKIVKIGTPSALKASLGGDIIEIGIKESSANISDNILRIKNVKEVKRTGGEYRIKAKDGEELAPKIIDMIRKKNYHITKIFLTKPTMDEVYLEYTGKSIRNEQGDKDTQFRQMNTIRTARM